VSRFLTAHQHS